MQYFTFLILKLFTTSGIKFKKMRIRNNFDISSSDLPLKVPDIYTKLIF